MSSFPDGPVEENPVAPADSGLRCPQCEYNLTGLTENRCPECGAAFDPDELRRFLEGRPGPIPGWDDRGNTNLIAAFFRVCRMTWFHPTDFARAFPWIFDPGSALRFGLMTRAVAVAIFIFGAFLTYAVCGFACPGLLVDPPDLWRYAVILVGAIVGSIACEGIMSVVLTTGAKLRIASTHSPSATASNSWGLFIGFYSSFLIPTAATTGAVANVLLALRPTDVAVMPWTFPLASVLVATFGANLVWWRYCLDKGVQVRAYPTSGTRIAMALFPVAIAMGLLIGSCCMSGIS